MKTKSITVTEGSSNEGFISYNGRNYAYKTIGTQTWMVENLAYLPAVSGSDTGSDTDKHYYVYGYEGTDSKAAKETDNYADYGVLYNWAAAQAACPEGWHLPNDDEWKTLELYLGMSESEKDATNWRYSGSVGGQLKQFGTHYWSSPNTDATNSSTFTALPGGSRSYRGGFIGLTETADFWTSSEDEAGHAWCRRVANTNGGVRRGAYDRGYGYSVRCVRN